jgi:hypothetical protein
MGLDFSHGDAHWTYSDFHAFRSELAVMVGIADLLTMEGFGGTRSFETLPDDIRPLLDHSDSDGTLSPNDCSRVARRLEELIDQKGEDWEHRDAGLALVEDLKNAASQGEPLTFG